MTTEFDITRWFRDGKEKGCTHLMVVCNTLTGNDRPIFVLAGEDARKKAAKYGCPAADGRPTRPNSNGDKVLEVYRLNRSLEQQLQQIQAFHLE